MAEIRWTKGPWQATMDKQVPERGAVYVSAAGLFDPTETIAEAYKTDRDVEHGTLEETEANAHLIAAAPSLYEALAKARSTLVVAIRANTNLGDDFQPEEHPIIKQIDAALAKARGER